MRAKRKDNSGQMTLGFPAKTASIVKDTDAVVSACGLPPDDAPHITAGTDSPVKSIQQAGGPQLIIVGGAGSASDCQPAVSSDPLVHGKKDTTPGKMQAPAAKSVPGQPKSWRVFPAKSVDLEVRRVCIARHADYTYYVGRAAATLLEKLEDLVIEYVKSGFLPKPSPNRDGRRIHVDRQILIQTIKGARSVPGCPSVYVVNRIASGVASSCLNDGLVDTVKKLIFEDWTRPCTN